MKLCPSCGEENPPRFRMCGYCGTALPVDGPAPREVRKTVTIVFTDLADSTALGERLDSEALREVMTHYFEVMRAALERHGGKLEKYIGDAVMAVFGLPIVYEDDALRAVRAAAAMQEDLRALNDELERRWGVRLQHRTGVNTGEVVAGDGHAGQRLVTGDAVNVAARLEQAAPTDQVLLGPLTHALVCDDVETEPLAPLTVKGKAEPVRTFRLKAVRKARRPPRRRAAFVGRDEELGRLEAALAALDAEAGARLVTLVGPAGVGKSRLADEFARRAGAGGQVVRCRCLSYGHGITFWPLAELVRSAAGIEEGDAPEDARERLRAHLGPEGAEIERRVASAIGLSTEEFSLEELFLGARKFLERLAGGRRLVVIVEDLHWAEPTFLDLLEHVTASADQPILLVGSARPELLEARPEWSEGARSACLELGLLSPEDTAEVVGQLLGTASLPETARRRIVAAADGNPLFAEQLLNMLIDEGRLGSAEEGWRADDDLGDMVIPPSIQALLGARIDQLAPEERAVLEAASVVGVEFEADAVRALAADGEEIEPHLRALARKELIAPEPAIDGFRFHHALIRDAAYGRLLKRARATLHERFVTWVADGPRGRGNDATVDGILGYHLEQAHRYLGELGPLDEHGRALGAQASRRLGDAGERAFAQDDMPAAANLLRRAVRLLPEDADRRRHLLLRLGEAYLDVCEYDAAEARLEEAAALAAGARDAPVATTASILRLLVQAQSGSDEDVGTRMVHEAAQGIALLEAAGERADAATLLRATAWAHGTAGRFGRTAEAAERAVDHAAASGDDRQLRRASAQYAVAAVYGPTPVPAAIDRCEEILAQASGDQRTQGLVKSLLARLLAMEGDFGQARVVYRDAQQTLQDVGQSVLAASTALDSCGVEMLAGDPVAAERELRRDYEALTAMGERYLLSTVAAELVRALVAQGRYGDALPYSHAAEEMAASDDVATQALWRSGRARLLAALGEYGEAVELTAQALALLDDTDAVVTRADILSDRAEVLAAAARDADAVAALAAMLDLHERKGNRPAADAARRSLEALAAQRM